MPDQLEQLNSKVKDLVDGVKTQFQKATNKIGSEVKDVLSDEMGMVTDNIKEGFDFVKDSSEKTVKFFATLFSWEKIGMTEEKRQTRTLKEMLELMKLDFRRKLMGGAATGKSLLAQFFDFIGIPLLVAGAVIGGFIAVIVKPFELIYKFITRFIMPIAKLFGGFILQIPKVDVALTKFLGFLVQMATKLKLIGPARAAIRGFRVLINLFEWLIKLPGIRMLVRGLKWGFKKLFWPLQIIISLIDFVGGFMETEGTLLDKVQGGIKNVIVKFLEFPLKLLGGLIDWILEGFGIERRKGETAKMMIKMLGDWIDMVFKGWKLIIGSLIDGAKWVWNKLEKLGWDGLIQGLKDWVTTIAGIPGLVKDKILKWLGLDDTQTVRQETPELQPEQRKIEITGTDVLSEFDFGNKAQQELQNQGNSLLEKLVQLIEQQNKKILNENTPTPIVNGPVEGGREIPAETSEVQLQSMALIMQ